MKLTRIALSLVCLFTLTACGGGGGISLPGSGGNFPQPNDSIAAQNQFASLVGTEGYTQPANFPTAANYEGVATLQRFGAQYYGILDMSVNFTGGTVSGTLDRFNEIDFSTTATTATDVNGSFNMAGTLTGSNSFFSNALNGSAAGSLDGSSDVLSVTGQFAGNNADGVELLLLGGLYQGIAHGN